MEDHFAALGLPRRAALDAGAVREAFQQHSKELHPDAGGCPEAFEAANRAHAVLADPAARLKHLAELEFGEAPDASGAVDPETMALFETVGAALFAADEFLGQRGTASSAVAKALLVRAEREAGEAVFSSSGAVRARKAEVLDRLAGIDAALAAGDREHAASELGECSRALAFLGKWEAQMAERMAALIAS